MNSRVFQSVDLGHSRQKNIKDIERSRRNARNKKWRDITSWTKSNQTVHTNNNIETPPITSTLTNNNEINNPILIPNINPKMFTIIPYNILRNNLKYISNKNNKEEKFDSFFFNSKLKEFIFS